MVMKATRHNGRSGKHGTYDAGIATAELLTEKQIAIYESMLHLIQKDFVKINLNKNNYNKNRRSFVCLLEEKKNWHP